MSGIWWMRRPKILLIGLALMIVILGSGLGLLWRSVTETSSQPVQFQAYERIRLGMTPTEVHSAIGSQPGNYGGGKPGLTSMTEWAAVIRETGISERKLVNEFGHAADTYKVERWIWPDYWIFVAYDGNERVVGFYLLEERNDQWWQRNRPRQPTMLDRFLRWLGF